MVRAVQVGRRRELVLVRVVVGGELPAEHLRRMEKERSNHESQKVRTWTVSQSVSQAPDGHLVELVVPAALQSVEGPAALLAGRGRKRGRGAAVHWGL